MPRKNPTKIKVAETIIEGNEWLITAINRVYLYNDDGNIEVGDTVDVDSAPVTRYTVHYMVLNDGVVVAKEIEELDSIALGQLISRNPPIATEEQIGYDALEFRGRAPASSVVS